MHTEIELIQLVNEVIDFVEYYKRKPEVLLVGEVRAYRHYLKCAELIKLLKQAKEK